MNRFKVMGVLFLLFACFTVAGNIRTGAAEVSPPIVVVENDWPPYYFADKPDKPEGFAKELLKMCLPATGYKFIFKYYPVKRMYSYLEKGEIDLAIFSYKESRESFVMYGREPLFSSGYRPIVLAGSGVDIRSLGDFDKLKLCHLAGLQYSDSFHEYIENRKKAGDLVTTTMGDSCLKMLLEGMVDVFVDTQASVLWRAKQTNTLNRIKVINYDIQTKKYYVTVSRQSKVIKDKKVFLDTLDQCIRTARENGRLRTLAEKYGMEESLGQ